MSLPYIKSPIDFRIIRNKFKYFISVKEITSDIVCMTAHVTMCENQLFWEKKLDFTQLKEMPGAKKTISSHTIMRHGIHVEHVLRIACTY
jgi:hypothetical protein